MFSDGEELLKFAVQNIALALFADFLYQLLFQDKVDQLKKLIHSRYENYKKNLNNKKILKQLEKYNFATKRIATVPGDFFLCF